MAGSIDVSAAISRTSVLDRYDMGAVIAQSDLAGSSAEGNHFLADESGRVRCVTYASGAKIIRHENYVMVEAVDATHWIGDCTGRWYRLD